MSAIINPGDFAAYAAVVVLAVTTLSVASAVIRRIAGPYGRRARLQAGMMGLGGVDPAEHEALKDEVARLRADLDSMQARVNDIDELQNRMDFTERVIGQMKNRPALPEAK